MVSVVAILDVLVLRVGKSPNSEPQLTENSPGLWDTANNVSLQICYFRLLNILNRNEHINWPMKYDHNYQFYSIFIKTLTI